MIHKRFILLTLLFSLTALLGHAQSNLEPIGRNPMTGRLSYKNHQPYQGENGGVDFRVYEPDATFKELVQMHKDRHPFPHIYQESSIAFGKSVFPGNKPDQYWIELTLYMKSYNEEIFFTMNDEVAQTFDIASADGIIQVTLDRKGIQQYRYKVVVTGEGSETYFIIRETIRIPLLADQFIAIKDHSHLGYEAYTSMGVVGTVIFEGKRWQKFQEGLRKLQNLSYAF